MSRKRSAPKKIPIVDSRYKSTIIPKLINSIMYDGKKTIAEKIVYDALEKIKSKTKDEPINIFNDAIKNVRPAVEVRSRRVGGATYQVPIEVRGSRQGALAHRWIIKAARDRSGRSMSEKLAQEFMDASRGQGSAVKRREDLHRMAEANRAFVHYKW